MKKIHTILFDTESKTPEDLIKDMRKAVETAYAKDKTEMKRIDLFITSLVKLVKVCVNDEEINPMIDKWEDDLLSKTPSTRRSFYEHYSAYLFDICDDIVGLSSDFKMLFKDKQEENEKPLVNKTINNQRVSKKKTQTSKAKAKEQSK